MSINSRNRRKQFLVQNPMNYNSRNILKIINQPSIDQRNKRFVVVLSNAIIEPFTMMIESTDTSITRFTMF